MENAVLYTKMRRCQQYKNKSLRLIGATSRYLGCPAQCRVPHNTDVKALRRTLPSTTPAGLERIMGGRGGVLSRRK